MCRRLYLDQEGRGRESWPRIREAKMKGCVTQWQRGRSVDLRLDCYYRLMIGLLL
jgi:hypothetical protein